MNSFEVENVKIGDAVLFDHFGGKNRRGIVTKITPQRIYIRWTSPSSGKERVVAFSLKKEWVLSTTGMRYSNADSKNIRVVKVVSWSPFPPQTDAQG